MKMCCNTPLSHFLRKRERKRESKSGCRELAEAFLERQRVRVKLKKQKEQD
jgi:hypothetical protein